MNERNERMKTVVDSKRGCGWRKEGGLYLVSGGIMASCGRMPIPLDRCPVCDCGMKPSRGWQWFNPRPFAEKKPCETPERCEFCPMGGAMPDKAGLLWIGEAFYKTPDIFLEEARKQGVSRRVKAVPRGFEVGKTWVYFAHRKALPGPVGEDGEATFTPGLVFAFRPSEVQYVTSGKESDEELAGMEKRGITPVRVVREGEFDLQSGQSLAE